MPGNDPQQRQRLTALAAQITPPADQRALLRAAFAAPGDFAARFADWAALVGDTPPRESYSLIQLLAPPLNRNQTVASRYPVLAALCRNQQRLTHAKAMLITSRLKPVLAMLREAAITPVVLKGVALQGIYAEPGMRAMGDADLLIASDQVEKTLQLFTDTGWQSVEFAQPTRFDPRFMHALGFTNGRGDMIDIHAHPMHHWASWEHGNALFCAQSVAWQAGDLTARTLSREHHIIHQIINGLGKAGAHGHWIADVVTLIGDERAAETIAWDGLAQDACTLGLAPIVGVALDMAGDYGAARSQRTLDRLRSQPVDAALLAFDRSLYAGTTASRLSGHWRTLTQPYQRGLSGALAQIPAYLRFCWARRGGLVSHLDAANSGA